MKLSNTFDNEIFEGTQQECFERAAVWMDATVAEVQGTGHWDDNGTFWGGDAPGEESDWMFNGIGIRIDPDAA